MQRQNLFGNLTPTSFFWIALGSFGVLLGAYWFYRYRLWYLYPSLGSVALGCGAIVCGLTNGFTDQSPFSRKLSKFGLLFLLIGALLVGYHVYRFI